MTRLLMLVLLPCSVTDFAEIVSGFDDRYTIGPSLNVELTGSTKEWAAVPVYLEDGSHVGG